MVRPFASGRARVGAQRLLPHIIFSGADMGIDPIQGPDVDHPAPSALAHMREGRLHRPFHGIEIEVEALGENVVALGFDARHVFAAIGVVDQYIDGAKFFDAGLHDTHDLIPVRDIAPAESSTRARIP